MTITDWIILVAVVIYVALAALAVKFPRGRGDWRKDKTETLYMALSASVFLMLLFLLWYVSAVIDWPSAITIILWSGLIVLIALVLVGIFVPRGVRFSFGKKERMPVDEEE